MLRLKEDEGEDISFISKSEKGPKTVNIQQLNLDVHCRVSYGGESEGGGASPGYRPRGNIKGGK